MSIGDNLVAHEPARATEAGQDARLPTPNVESDLHSGHRQIMDARYYRQGK